MCSSRRTRVRFPGKQSTTNCETRRSLSKGQRDRCAGTNTRSDVDAAAGAASSFSAPNCAEPEVWYALLGLRRDCMYEQLGPKFAHPQQIGGDIALESRATSVAYEATFT